MEIKEGFLQEFARRPEAAVPLSRLGAGAGSEPEAGVDEALRGAARHPHLLRIVDGWRGPWTTLAPDPGQLPVEVRSALACQGMPDRAWAVPLGPADDLHPGGPAIRRLRETVRYLGRVVDVDSTRDVTRWIRLLRELEVVDGGLR